MAELKGKKQIGIKKQNCPHLIPGYHAVGEVLKKGHIKIIELWVASGKSRSRAKDILILADKNRIPVLFKKNAEFDAIFPDIAHQGIAALAENITHLSLDDLIDTSLKTLGKSLVIAIDHITDEGNLGAIIRTAAFFGADGLILPKDRSAQISGRVMKRSSGAYVHLPTAIVTNLRRSLDLLSKKGFWVIGTDGQSPESIFSFDWDRDTVLVLGSEDKGISSSIKSRCDQLVSIPSNGNVESLNVSVATGVILSEIFRQKK